MISSSAAPDHPPSLLDNITARLPHLNKLWAFSCPITKGHAVTCMAWNPANLVSVPPVDKRLLLASYLGVLTVMVFPLQSIIAIGFGELKGAAAESTSGLICCWSLKNPEVVTMHGQVLCNSILHLLPSFSILRGCSTPPLV